MGAENQVAWRRPGNDELGRGRGRRVAAPGMGVPARRDGLEPAQRAVVLIGCVLVGLGVSVCEGAPNVKCFEGQVTYCGINADGAAIARPGSKRHAEGMNWACTDQLSNLDPTYIAPNCHDKESCEALQTSDIDDPFDIEHSSPYNYVADKAFISAARSPNKTATESCPADHPACGLQTTLREAKGKTCEQCYTRFRYTADIGAIYWRVFQIKKECIAPEQPCHNNTACWCTTKAPYYKGGKVDLENPNRIKQGTEDPKYCSPWAKAACRRKVYKCMHFPADYVMTTFQDYDIKFCSVGSDDKDCSGCVACTDDRCQQPVIHVSKLAKGANLLDPNNYNCSVEKCGEAPRTCWGRDENNQTCEYTDNCWPECDASIYQEMVPGAQMGFYVGREDKMVERVKCCNSHFCNFPNAGARVAGSWALSILVAAVALSTGCWQ